MPWTGSEFRQRHNHALSPTQAEHAAHIANAILQRSGNERIAIATANKLVRRDDGGSLPMASAMGNAPQVRAMVQRYSAMPQERLQEMALMMGNSPQGQIVNRVLQQKRMMGGSQPPAQTQDQQQQSMGGYASGGMLRRALGGPSMSEANPWWTRQEAYATGRPASGFLAGTTPGRADSIKTTAPSGAYVMPADVIAGLGEGNSLSGAHVMDMILRSGPHGIPMPRGSRGAGPPRPPRPMAFQAKGGGVQDGVGGHVDVALSDGEYVVSPEDVAALGGGDMKRGHRILDHLVLELRARHIKKLKELKAPVGAKMK